MKAIRSPRGIRERIMARYFKRRYLEDYEPPALSPVFIRVVGADSSTSDPVAVYTWNPVALQRYYAEHSGESG